MVRALDTAGTAEALDRYRERAGRTLAGSVVALVGGVVVGILPGPAWTGDVVAWAVCLGVVFACVGAGALVTARRMRAVLAAGEWSAHAAVPVARRLHSPAVVLSSPATGALWPLTVVAVRWRQDAARPGPDGVLWWCGDPRTGGVLTRPHSGELFWAKPVRGGGARRRVVGRAEERGLPTAVVPAGPRPAAGPQSTAGPQSATGPEPAAGPQSTAGPQSDSAGTAPPAKPRRPGRWRWLVLASVLVLAPAVPWGLASVDDPQIDLTVLSEEPGGACVVRWKDPWDGREHTGPFRCDPDRDPLLAKWETAFVVSYGPWKGELYGWVGDEPHGSPAQDVTAALATGGALGLLVGLVGGGVSLRRRGRGGPVRVPAAATPVGTAPAPTYERLAALAGRQPAPGVRGPEADVRSAPWWRVRGLRRISGLSEVLVTTGCCAFAGGLLLLPLEGFERVSLFGLGGVSLLLLALWTFRFLTGGAGAARLLARAATAPVPVVRRYALLHDPRDDAPVLVLFPAHGGPEDLPEAVLPLVPPGPQKKPRLGLPPSPTGTAELRGWLDRTDDGQPVVVAWIDDRPLWPAGPYRETGTTEATSLLTRLAPPPLPDPQTLP
ncbi:hypothetical protein [Streptomyces sp. NPDC088752]|uniref:hypothetical protein n=1 Tax=Streptomyces sp. NPDC088752 TaxID=3154963 RepID=UPI0034301CD6